MVGMTAIIPAKCNSTRVPNKNWLPFHGWKCLVDINIEALLNAGVEPYNIYVSCENPDRLEQVSRRWGICCLQRDASLCDNSVGLTTWIRTICGQVSGDDDIIWSQVCDPLFDEHRQVIELWNECRKEHDSICVVHKAPHYLLSSDFNPIGWGFGDHHVCSQELRANYTFPFTMSILKREAISKIGYHVGDNPRWYVSGRKCIDIDTQEDFDMCRILYERSK